MLLANVVCVCLVTARDVDVKNLTVSVAVFEGKVSKPFTVTNIFNCVGAKIFFFIKRVIVKLIRIKT